MIGATLSNSSVVNIGNTGLSKATMVTATRPANAGLMRLEFSRVALGSLNIQGAAPALTGNINILGNALLEFASGAVGGIARSEERRVGKERRSRWSPYH